MVRSSRMVLQTVRTSRLKPFQPLIGSGGANAKAPAQMTDVSVFSSCQSDEFKALRHDGNLFPRHLRSSYCRNSTPPNVFTMSPNRCLPCLPSIHLPDLELNQVELLILD